MNVYFERWFLRMWRHNVGGESFIWSSSAAIKLWPTFDSFQMFHVARVDILLRALDIPLTFRFGKFYFSLKQCYYWSFLWGKKKCSKPAKYSGQAHRLSPVQALHCWQSLAVSWVEGAREAVGWVPVSSVWGVKQLKTSFVTHLHCKYLSFLLVCLLATRVVANGENETGLSRWLSSVPFPFTRTIMCTLNTSASLQQSTANNIALDFQVLFIFSLLPGHNALGL